MPVQPNTIGARASGQYRSNGAGDAKRDGYSASTENPAAAARSRFSGQPQPAQASLIEPKSEQDASTQQKPDRTSGATSGTKATGSTRQKAKSSKRRVKKVRYAVVGLGHIAQVAVLPAFKNAEETCELAALITDDSEKLEKLSEEYGVEHTAGYDDFEQCLEDADIDAVYIALPNSMHAEFCIRAARVGVHVLCEKPLAVTVDECMDMIEACDEAGVQLMTAYRLHFEHANLQVMEKARSGELGDIRAFSSVFTMQVRDPENIRLKARMGGGPLHDLGVYCINAARSIFRAEPTLVYAQAAMPGDPRFQEVPETVAATLHYPGERIAQFMVSFGMADIASYCVVGTKGQISVDPAFEYSEGLAFESDGEEGNDAREYAKRDQFAPQLMHFAECVRSGVRPEPSGLEGLADVRIVRALQWSIRTGRPAHLRPWDPPDLYPSLSQARRARPVEKPVVINSNSPSLD